MSLLGRTFQKINSITGGNITRMIANKLIEDYGELSELIIDKQQKMVSGSALLIGETSPIRFQLNYEISMDAGRYFISFSGAKIDRDWLNRLAQNFLLKREFEIPASKFKLISDLLV